MDAVITTTVACPCCTQVGFTRCPLCGYYLYDHHIAGDRVEQVARQYRGRVSLELSAAYMLVFGRVAGDDLSDFPKIHKEIAEFRTKWDAAKLPK